MGKRKEQIANAAASEVTDAELDNLTATALAGAGFIGAADLKPRTETGSTTLYGEFRVDNSNPFLKYEQISQISPHTFIPLAKLGLSLVTGFRLESKDEKALEQLQEWVKKVNLTNKAQNIARCMVRDGTAVVYLPQEGKGEKGIKSVDILPMKYTTLLPEGIQPGTRSTTLMKGEIDRAVLNESHTYSDKSKEVVMEREEFALFRAFHEGCFMSDIMGRDTYGIYGTSLLVNVDRSVKNLMDLVEGFSGYMRRYGVGRLHVDVKLVEELRRQGKRKEAKELLEDIIGAQRRLAPNEDIVSGGVEVKPLATGHVAGIENMKTSLENDIAIGLLQSPLTMGKAKGSTFASSYMVEEDRYIVLESLQKIFIETLQNEIINKQLKVMGYEINSVKVMVDKLDEPYTEPKTLLEAFMNDILTMEEMREKIGFPAKKPKPELT